MNIEKLFHAPFYLTQGRPVNTVFGNKVIFLTLHRIRSKGDEGDLFNNFIDISADHLEQIILHLQKEKVRFVSMKDLETEGVPGNQVCVHFTIDDGYKDTLENGLPLFEKHGVPFTLFLTTGIPDHEAVLWWYALSEVLNRNLEFVVKPFNIHLKPWLMRAEEKNDVFQRLRQVFLDQYASAKELLDTAFRSAGVAPEDILHRQGLSWSEIKKLQRSERCTIAVHTHHHYRLSELSRADVAREIRYAQTRIQQELGIRSPYFAYPFGAPADCCSKEFLKELQLSHHFTTSNGIIRKMQDVDPYSIPRYFINNQTTPYSLNMMINGMRYYTNKLLY